MPVSRDLAADLARALVQLYDSLATRLSEDMARELAANIDSPQWASQKLAALQKLRKRAQRLLDRLESSAAENIAQALVLAYYRGGVEGLKELTRLQLTPFEKALANTRLKALGRLRRLAGKREAALWRELEQIKTDLPGVDAIQRLAWSLASMLRGTHTPLLRWQDDIYRKVVAETSLVDVLAGLKTRRRAAQVTWERFLREGVKGFTDRSGRRWELASYVEMAVRTGTAQAAVEGHMDRLADANIDLVIVSNAPQECILCRPWEGEVLARVGSAGNVQAENILTGRPTTVRVKATVTQAVAAGLMHPNCRHSLSAYMPGVTKSPTHTQDPQGDADRQRLRELERRLRRAKLKAASIIDPNRLPALKARVREIQAQIREHVETTSAKRQRPREQIGVAR